MRRGFEQENLYTLSKHATEFKNKVKVLIENDEERVAFYEALQGYQGSNSPQKLVNDLKSVINTPKRYPLFREVKYLVKPADTTAYLNLIPKLPSDGIRLIKLEHFGNSAIGFSVRGGQEHGVGIFVSLVSRGSQADIVGLKAGDEILSINGLYIAESTHGEVVSILRSHRNLLVKVRTTGKVPCKINDIISWETAEGKENVYYHPDLLDYLIKEGDFVDEPRFEPAPDDKQVALVVGPKGIGCSVRNGIPGKEGLFIISVTSGSLADKTGARIGDQIVAVNGKNIMKLRYSEAIYLLKSFKELQLVLRHDKEAEKFIMEEIAKQQKDKLPEFAIKTQLLTRKAGEKERLDKAKEEMHFKHLLQSKREEDDQVHEKSTAATEGKEENPEVSQLSNTQIAELTPNSRKRAAFSETVQVVLAGTSKNYHTESGIEVANVHPAPLLHPSNVQFEDDVLEGREAHFLSIEKVSQQARGMFNAKFEFLKEMGVASEDDMFLFGRDGCSHFGPDLYATLRILHLSEGQFKQLLEEQIRQKRSEDFDDIGHVLDQPDEGIKRNTSWRILELVYRAENNRTKRKQKTVDKDSDRKQKKRKNIQCNSTLNSDRCIRSEDCSLPVTLEMNSPSTTHNDGLNDTLHTDSVVSEQNESKIKSPKLSRTDLDTNVDRAKGMPKTSKQYLTKAGVGTQDVENARSGPMSDEHENSDTDDEDYQSSDINDDENDGGNDNNYTGHNDDSVPDVDDDGDDGDDDDDDEKDGYETPDDDDDVDDQEESEQPITYDIMSQWPIEWRQTLNSVAELCVKQRYGDDEMCRYDSSEKQKLSKRQWSVVRLKQGQRSIFQRICELVVEDGFGE